MALKVGVFLMLGPALTGAASGAAPGTASGAAAGDGNIGDLRFGAAYARARNISPDLQEARASLRAAERTLDAAHSAYLPQLGAKADYDYIHQHVNGDYYDIIDIDRGDTFNRYGYGLGLSQGLYRPDLLGAIDLAKVGITGAGLVLDETESQVAVQVARDYFTVVDTLETLRASYAELSATAEQLRQTESRQQYGLVKESDVALVRAALASAEADKIDAENNVETARLKLALAIGADFTRVGVLMAQTPLPRLTPSNLDAWVKTAIDNRAALAAAKQGTEAARLGVEAAKSARLPKLDLVGSRVWFDSSGGISGARTDLDERIGIELKLPLFTSGAISATVGKAEAQYETAQARARGTEMQIRAGVQRAFMAAQSSYSQIDARKRAVDAAHDAERTAQVGLDVGTVTLADWLQSVRKRYEAERDFARERLVYLRALIELKAAAGVLGREDMSRVELLLKLPDPGWPAPTSFKPVSEPDAGTP